MFKLPNIFHRKLTNKETNAVCSSLVEATALGHSGSLSVELQDQITSLGASILKMAKNNGLDYQTPLPFFVGLNILKDPTVAKKINVQYSLQGSQVNNSNDNSAKKTLIPSTCPQDSSSRCMGCLQNLISYSERFYQPEKCGSLDELVKYMLSSFFKEQELGNDD